MTPQIPDAHIQTANQPTSVSEAFAVASSNAVSNALLASLTAACAASRAAASLDPAVCGTAAAVGWEWHRWQWAEAAIGDDPWVFVCKTRCHKLVSVRSLAQQSFLATHNA
jgi:hypothetical protein